jgi:hypothetical protein
MAEIVTEKHDPHTSSQKPRIDEDEEPEVYTPESLATEAAKHGFHEHRSGRLVIDPKEARAEFGDVIADRLKLSKDGRFVLWPQPTNRPEDPQNVSAIEPRAAGPSDFQHFVSHAVARIQEKLHSSDHGCGSHCA